MAFWLMKTEPDGFSLNDLIKCHDQTTFWEGVRNYQARNFMRDTMQVGDGVLFYHSSTSPSAVVGTAKIRQGARPDPTQFDPKSQYYDAKATPKSPRWFVVGVKYQQTFNTPVTLSMIRSTPRLAEMLVIKKGMRLSIQPVTQQQWEIVSVMGMA